MSARDVDGTGDGARGVALRRRRRRTSRLATPKDVLNGTDWGILEDGQDASTPRAPSSR